MNEKNTSLDETCGVTRARLHDYVDGLLTGAEERSIEDHLGTCRACAGEADALRGLLAEAADLPRSLAPPRDLWPGVAARLGERKPAPVIAGPWRRWALQAVAALFFMAVGAGLMLVLRPASPASQTVTATLGAGDVVPASAAGGFEVLEAEYLSAKAELWLLAYSRREELSPETVRLVERNMRIIEAAIRDLRGVLESRPGDQQVEGLILAKHRRGVELLQRLTGQPARL